MGEQTAIEWTDATWNPFQGCTKVDGDCKFCYMYRDKERYGQDPTKLVRSAPATFDGILNAKKYPADSLVFSASWSDWGHPDAAPHLPDAWDRVRRRPDLRFQLLSKRDWRRALPEGWTSEGWPNVWLGTSVGNPKGADRARALAEVPAVVRFLSIEPLWAPGVAAALRDVVESGRIDWIILGGESGSKARPMHPDWAREVRDLAIGAGVPLLFKQWGEWAPWVNEEHFTHGGREDRAHTWLDGETGATGACWITDDDGLWSNWTGEPRGHASEPDGDGHSRLHPAIRVMGWHGKKAAGRTLDGVIHDGYPVPRAGSFGEVPLG
jgi:protein gp37